MYNRTCPFCNNVVSHTNKGNRNRFEGKPCLDCKSKLLREKQPEYKNVCIQCGCESPVKYKGRVKPDWKCFECKNTKEKICVVCQMPFTTKSNPQTCSYRCMNILIARNIGGPNIDNLSQIPEIRVTRRVGGGKRQDGENNGMWGKKHSQETKRKIRLARTQRFLDTGLSPKINPKACEEIDKFADENGYSFLHGGNGNEHYIKELGYYLDGYDKENNIVVEYDELHHQQPHQQKKDRRREQEIINLLKCKFIRLVETKDGNIEVKYIN